MSSDYKQAIACEFFPVSVQLGNNSKEAAPKRRQGAVFLRSTRLLPQFQFESEARAVPPGRGTLFTACTFPSRGVWGTQRREGPGAGDGVKITHGGSQPLPEGCSLCLVAHVLFEDVGTAAGTCTGGRTLRSAAVDTQDHLAKQHHQMHATYPRLADGATGRVGHGGTRRSSACLESTRPRPSLCRHSGYTVSSMSPLLGGLTAPLTVRKPVVERLCH